MSIAALQVRSLPFSGWRSRVAVLLAACLATFTLMVATPSKAEAAWVSPAPGVQIGYDGTGWNAHLWIKMTDHAAVQNGAAYSAQLACERFEPGLGAGCRIAVSTILAHADWHGWNDHGTWVEYYPWGGWGGRQVWGRW